MPDLDTQASGLQPFLNTNILVDITLCKLPIHYVQDNPLMLVRKKED